MASIYSGACLAFDLMWEEVKVRMATSTESRHTAGHWEAGQSWVPLRMVHKCSWNLFYVLSSNAWVLLFSCTYILCSITTAFLLIAEYIIRKGCHITAARRNSSPLWPAVVLASFVQNVHSSWVKSVSVCIRSMCNCWQSHMQAAGAWCQYQVHDSCLQIRDITISTQQPNLLPMPSFTGSFSGYQDQFSYHSSWWLSYMHPQEVVLHTSCDTDISLLLKTLLSLDNTPGMPFTSLSA